MIIVPNKNLYLLERKWGAKRFQRGIFGLLQMTGIPAAGLLPAWVGDPYSATDSQTTPTDAEAGVELDVDGSIDRILSTGTQPDIGRWDGNNSLDGNDYDFRVDTISGTLNGPGTDTADVWHNGGALIVFSVEETGIGTTVFTGTLRMRPAGGGADIDTASCSFTAESVP